MVVKLSLTKEWKYETIVSIFKILGQEILILLKLPSKAYSPLFSVALQKRSNIIEKVGIT